MDSIKKQKLQSYITYLLMFAYADSTIIRMSSARLSVKPREAKEVLASIRAKML